MNSKSWYLLLSFWGVYYFIVLLFVNVLGPHLSPYEAKSYNLFVSFLLFVISVLALRLEKMTFKSIGISLYNLLSGVLGLLLLWLLVDTVCVLALYFTRGELIAAPFIEYHKLKGWSFYYFIYYWLFVGPVEEIAFRGYIQSKLVLLLEGTDRSRRATAIVLASVLFCLIHLPTIITNNERLNDVVVSGLFYLVLMSILIGYMYDKSKNLYLAGLMHSSLDYPLPLVIGTWKSGLYLPPFVYTAILLVAAIGAVGFYFRHTGRRAEMIIPPHN